MKFDAICYGCALVGVILTVLGRRLLIMEAASISTGWSWAIRLLPLADVMFLARFWESAKTGALMSLVGLAFLAPLGGKKLWDQEHPKPVDTKAAFGRLDGDQKNALFLEIKMEHDGRVHAKQAKLVQLNAHMGAWYQSMQDRRAAVTSATPAEIAGYNEEAAAYSALLAVSKREAAALQTLMSRQLDGWGSISDDEYIAYQHKQEERARRVKKSLVPSVGGADERDE